MSGTGKTLSWRGRVAAGLFCIAMGIFPMLATFNIGPLGTGDINGPAWLGAASGGIFVAAGLAVLAGQQRVLLNAVLSLLILALLAAIANWIAFGVGERVCSGSVMFLWQNDWNDMACRIPFGIGAVMMDGVVVMVLVVILQKAFGGPPRLAGLRTFAENLLLVCLTPVLVPLLLFLFARIGIDVVKTRLSTGQWPRNEEFAARMKRRKQGKQPPQ